MKRTPQGAALVVAAASLIASWPASSRADATLACAGSYEMAQERRSAGELQDAREQLRLCVQEDCPSFVRSDCIKWLAEVEAAIPTAVFAARQGGEDLRQVKVFRDGRPLLEDLQGKPIELNPGPHTFRFEIPDAAPVSRALVIQPGEKNRLILVVFPAKPPARPIPKAPPAKPAPPVRGRSWALPLGMGAVGVVGLTGFVTFAAWGRSQERDLSGTCSPKCSDEQLAPVRTKYLVADVSLGVGMVALAAAIYFWLQPGRADSGPLARRLTVDAAPTPGGASATVLGRF